MNQQQIKLIYPTIELFIYDLRKGLNQNDDEVALNREAFWRKVYGDSQHNQAGKKLDSKLCQQLAEREKEGNNFVQLLTDESGFVENFELPLEGYYYPLQLDDSYALHVDCSGFYIDPQKQISNFKPQEINAFSHIKEQVFTHIGGKEVKGKLGQTWMLWAQLTTACDKQQIEDIAKECFQQLGYSAEWDTEYVIEGKLLGATVFDLSRISSGTDNQKNESNHVLIWLFPHTMQIENIRDKVAEIYIDLIRLFAYRHKIIWAYTQSQEYQHDLEKDYDLIEEKLGITTKRKKKSNLMTKFNNSLSVSDLDNQIISAQIRREVYPIKKHDILDSLQNNLQETLELLADYSHDLRELNIQGHTIKVNLENYQERLKRLNKKDDDPEKNLIFLQEFSNFATRRYQGQLESVYEFFSPGLTLIESLIKNTEGTIAIQQARNERQLNQTVGIASIGLATSQIASAVILATDKPKSDFTFTDRASAFTVSLGIGILAAAIVFMFFHKYARK